MKEPARRNRGRIETMDYYRSLVQLKFGHKYDEFLNVMIDEVWQWVYRPWEHNERCYRVATETLNKLTKFDIPINVNDLRM